MALQERVIREKMELLLTRLLSECDAVSSAWPSSYLDFPTGGTIGRNRPLDKEHIFSFLWLLPERVPDVSVHSVGSLIIEAYIPVCPGFFLSSKEVKEG